MTAQQSTTITTRNPDAARRQPARRRWPFSPWHLLLLPVAVIFLVPFLEMIITSLEPAAEINKFPPSFFPRELTLDGYRRLFAQSDILHWLLNTVIVSASGITSHLVLCSLAGYGFARLRFPGRGLGFLAVLATIMIPAQLLMIPTYVMFAKLHIINSLGAAIVPWLASAFGIFLMRQFFMSLPREVEEAGMIDGCNRLQVFFRIVLPLARPALTTLAIFTLLGSWNDLVWPLIAINDPGSFTLQLGLSNFQGTRRTDWSLLMAGNVIATAPLLLLFLLAQRQFVATMASAGLKG
ncbi:carbohydrate ABC transporter permease [Brachybacterium alimentarium]|uniref:carbohydrate ABC transporter permease n=1 Tax=Brachybacterium alimentarium TaxID=47845 RepID=UPI003FD64D1E